MKFSHWGLVSAQRLQGPATPASSTNPSLKFGRKSRFLRKLFREKSQRKTKVEQRGEKNVEFCFHLGCGGLEKNITPAVTMRERRINYKIATCLRLQRSEMQTTERPEIQGHAGGCKVHSTRRGDAETLEQVRGPATSLRAWVWPVRGCRASADRRASGSLAGSFPQALENAYGRSPGWGTERREIAFSGGQAGGRSSCGRRKGKWPHLNLTPWGGTADPAPTEHKRRHDPRGPGEGSTYKSPILGRGSELQGPPYTNAIEGLSRNGCAHDTRQSSATTGRRDSITFQSHVLSTALCLGSPLQRIFTENLSART